MADRFPAEISIGGNIPRRRLDDLAGMIASEGVSIDWQYTLDKAAVQKAIEDAAARGQTVRFTDDEARYGEFMDLEIWLTAHGIDFDRHSDARYEYNAENVYGRGRRRPVSMSSDQDGHDMVGAEEVRAVLAGKSTPEKKLNCIPRMVRVPPALGPVVLTGRKTPVESGGVQP